MLKDQRINNTFEKSMTKLTRNLTKYIIYANQSLTVIKVKVERRIILKRPTQESAI